MQRRRGWKEKAKKSEGEEKRTEEGLGRRRAVMEEGG